jgi:hypothetical protein
MTRNSKLFDVLLQIIWLHPHSPLPASRGYLPREKKDYTVPKIPFMYSQKKELLRGLSPNSYIYVSVSNLYIPRIDAHIWLQQNRQTDPGNI